MGKRHYMVPGLMSPGGEARQGGKCGGGACYCLNLRRSGAGGLEPVRGGALLAATGAEAVMADRRDYERNFFTLDAGLNLRLSVVEGEDGKAVRRDELVARLPAGIADYAVCGEFLVVRLADDRLFFLLWHADERRYSALGTLPEFGGVSVRRVGETEITASVAPAKFTGTVADPREGDPATYAASAVASVREAFGKAMRTAREAGYWTQPVAVRVAWRLWDGTLLHLSGPAVAAESVPQTGGRVSLALTAGDKGYTGTAAGTLRLPACRLEVELPSALPAGWEDVVGSVEVWVSEEPDPLDGGASVGLHSQGSALSIGVSLGARSASSVAESVVASAMEKAETLAPTAGGAAVSLTRREPRGKRLDPAEAPSAPMLSATAIEGHGDYLHLASRGKVATTMRGNPFVVAWESLSPGGRVAAMAAQPVGGGAYTRQYVYLFTDRGITALTHDMEGRHRNMRQISRSVVRSRLRVASGEEGVYAVGEDGELLLLRDSSARTLVRGLEGYSGLAFERRHRELWLFAPGRSRWMAVDTEGDGLLASMRSEVWERVPVDCGGRLYVFGARSVSVLESPDGEELDMEWESVPAEWPVGGAASVGVCLRSDAADVSVAVWSHGSFQPATQARPACLGRWDIRGGFNGTAHGSLMLPAAKTRPMLSLSVAGRASRLESVEILSQ